MPPGYHSFSSDRNGVPTSWFWVRESDGQQIGPFNSVEDAQQDAQADYDRRRRSQLN